MAFKLPNYGDLTRKQRDIVNVPAEKDLIVRGPPGTGKSVLAVYRTEQLSKSGYNVLFLVYNKPLKEFIASAVNSRGIDSSIVNTWNSWIREFYRKKFRETIGTDFTYDWDEIQRRFASLGNVYDVIIVDETQDMPKELIESLSSITTSLTCFLDENQTIGNEYTSEDDLDEILPDAFKPDELTENFRNTEEILDFAQLYNTDVTEPTRNGPKPQMIRCSGYGHTSSSQIGSRMLEFLGRNGKYDTIAVLVNPSALNATYNELKEALDELKDVREDWDVFMYKSMTAHRSLDFDKPGIYVLSFGTMKGLEFDAVLIPKCESIKKNASDDIDRNRFYVAITRATREVCCFYVNNSSSYTNFDVFKYIKGHNDVLNWVS